MNQKQQTAIKGTMNHENKSFSTEIFSGAIIREVQYLAQLRFLEDLWPHVGVLLPKTHSAPSSYTQISSLEPQFYLLFSILLCTTS
jgi:hypothetical protein